MIAQGTAAGVQHPFVVEQGVDGNPYHLYPFQTGFGAPVFGTDANGGYDSTKLELGNAGGDAFATWLGSQGKNGTGVFNTEITGGIANEAFTTGKAAFWLTGPWNVGATSSALSWSSFRCSRFFNTVPASIDEAAKIDGAGHARIFFTIILRLVGPILSVVGLLLSFSSVTNEFVVASVLLIDPEKQTLAVGLYKLVSNPNYADWSAFSAGAVLAALPVMAVFLFLQKYIVGGLTAGAVK